MRNQRTTRDEVSHLIGTSAGQHCHVNRPLIETPFHAGNSPRKIVNREKCQLSVDTDVGLEDHSDTVCELLRAYSRFYGGVHHSRTRSDDEVHHRI